MASADPSPIQSTINLPQLAVLILVGFLAVRWIFSSSGSSTSQQPPGRATAASRGAGPRVNPTHVDTLSQMFPQLNRREIMWDLQRNGGNVQATTERLLSGRGLETPPPTFQPIIESTSQANVPTRDSSSTPSKPKQPDLIQRYNLDSKIRVAEAGSADQESPKVAWSANKTDRQTALQKRREDMILAARRKMLEKEKEGSS